MKTKWIVEYWNHDSDTLVKKGFHTHEDAVTHKEKVSRKYNSTNVKVYLRGLK